MSGIYVLGHIIGKCLKQRTVKISAERDVLELHRLFALQNKRAKERKKDELIRDAEIEAERLKAMKPTIFAPDWFNAKKSSANQSQTMWFDHQETILKKSLQQFGNVAILTYDKKETKEEPTQFSITIADVL